MRRALEPDHYDVHTDFTAQLDDKYKRVHICKVFLGLYGFTKLAD